MISDDDAYDIIEEAVGSNKALLYKPCNLDDLVSIVRTTEKWIKNDIQSRG